MSSSVDNRIVQMTFDNKQFENGVQTSLNTLGKLNDALKFNDGAGINNLASSLEGLNQKFSTLGIIGANVVSRLTQEFMNNLMPILNTVSRTISSLTFNFETMAESFGKYEQMVTNQQTIMSAVGDKINEVTGELYNMSDVADIIDRLRWYTDETSYNLDQMVGAIGDFTASGIDLGQSEQMILGIANACADAGISADKADIAMRGFSRAIGSGGLTLQVWNTMLKTSGITNSERFRQSLLDAAEAAGTLVRINGKLMTLDKKHEVTLSNLTETLTEYGWASTKVLNKVLSDYSNTVGGIYSLTDDGTIDLATEAFSDLTKAMEEQGKTISDLKLDKQYDQASEAIAALTNAYEVLGLEVPKSLKAFTRAQEAVSLTQAVDATATAVRSQWAKTFELIFGNYEEAKRLWTGVSNSMWGIFAGGGDDRNEILSNWHSTSVSSEIEKRFKATLESYSRTNARARKGFKIGQSEEAFLNDYFNQLFPDGLDTFSSLSEALSAFDKAYNELSKELDKDNPDSHIASAINAHKELEQNLKVLKEMRDNFGDYAKSPYERFSEGIISAFEGIEIAANTARTMFKQIISDSPAQFIDNISDSLRRFTNSFADKMDSFVEFAEHIQHLVEAVHLLNYAKFGDQTENLMTALDKITGFTHEADDSAEIIADLVEEFGSLEEVISKLTIVDNVRKTFRGLLSVFDLAKQAVSGFWRATEPLRELLGQIAIKILEATGSFGEWITGLSESAEESDFFYNVFKKLVDIIMGVGVPAFELLSNIFKNVKEFLAPLGDLFTNTKEAVKEFLGSISDKNVERIKNLTDFFKLLGDILGKVVDRIFAAAKRIGAAFKELFGDISLKDIGEIINTFLKGGILAKILSMFNHTAYDLGTITSSIQDVFYTFSQNLSAFVFESKIKAVQLAVLATGILVLAIAMKKLADINPSRLASAAVGMAAIFTELTIATRFMSAIEGKGLNKKMSSLIGFSAAIWILSSALAKIGKLSWEQIERGVVGLGLVMAELVIASRFMKRMRTSPAKLLALSAAMLVFALDMKIIGSMEWEEIKKGVTGIGVILAELAAFFTVMKKFGGSSLKIAASAVAIATISASMLVFAGVLKILATMDNEQIAKGLIAIGVGLAEFAIAAALMKDALPAAAALLIMSSAIAVLTPSLVVLGLLSWESIAKGLITLAGALAIFVAAGKLLKGSEITILAFSAAIALAGVGIAAFAVGITTLAAGLSAGAVIIAESLVLIISSLASLIPTIIEKIGEGIIAVIELIGNSATAIVEAAVQIGMALLIGIEELIPKIIETGVTVILSLLQGIADNIYQIVILAGKIVTEFLDGVAEVIPDVIESGINLMVSFINGMADGIVQHTDDILDAIGRLMTAIAYFVVTALDNLTKDIPLIGDKIHGKLSEIKADLEKEMSKEEGEKIGSNISSGVATGIEKNQSKAITAAGNLAAKTLKAAKDKLGIQSPSKAFAEVGKYADEGLAEGMYRFTSKVTDASSSIADSALTALENPMKNIADIVSDEIGMDPVITPVLDLSQIQNGAKNIGSMFGTASIRGIGSIGGYYGGSVNDGGTYSPTVNVTIYASEGQTSDDLYDTFTRRLNSDVRRRSLLWE